MTPPRPAGAYLHGGDGPVVLVTARVAAWIEAQTGLDALRSAVRGADPEVDAVLLALHQAALGYRETGSTRYRVTSAGSAKPEADLQKRWGSGDLEWLTTSGAAMASGVSARAIRAAIAEQRLPAIRQGARWYVRRDDAERYRDQRPPP